MKELRFMGCAQEKSVPAIEALSMAVSGRVETPLRERRLPYMFYACLP